MFGLLNLGVGSTGGPPPFVISDLGAKLKLDLNADENITLNGSDVSAWGDDSGNGNNATQGTGSAQPVYTTGALNGHAVVDFNGSSEFLAGTAISNILANSTYVVWVVVSTDTTTLNAAQSYNNHCIWGDAGGFVGLFAKNNGPTAIVFNWDGNEDQVAASHTNTTYTIIRARHEGGNIYIKHGDGAESSGVASGNTSTITGLFRLGKSAGASTWLDGKIARVIAVNASCTNDELTNVHNLLKTEYGL